MIQISNNRIFDSFINKLQKSWLKFLYHIKNETPNQHYHLTIDPLIAKSIYIYSYLYYDSDSLTNISQVIVRTILIVNFIQGKWKTIAIFISTLHAYTYHVIMKVLNVWMENKNVLVFFIRKKLSLIPFSNHLV